jgi:hypothetical protein
MTALLWLVLFTDTGPAFADTGLDGLEQWDPYQQGQAPDWATPGETLIVNPDNNVSRSRGELGGALGGLGYSEMKRRGDWTIYLAEPPWYPKVMVHDSGYMMIKRRGVHFRLPDLADWGGLEKPLEVALCLIQPTSCIRIHGLLVSKRRLRWKEQEVVDKTRREMMAFQDSLADAGLASRIAGLVEVLNHLWRDGVQAGTEVVLDGAPAKRQAIIDMWQAPASNRWGDTVRSHIEVFIDDVVQVSDTPFLLEEIVRANKGRQTERVLEPVGSD